MNQNSLNTSFVSILCATSLAVGIAIPALAVTPPTITTPTTKPAPFTKPKPATTQTPTPKASPATIPVSQPQVPSNSLPLVVVTPLTTTTLKNFTSLYGQLLEVKFTPNQEQKIQQRLRREWITNLGLRNTVGQTIALEPQILRGTPAERSQLQARSIANLRQQVLDGDTDALWLVSFFDASSKNWLAPGQPPLTRMTTDISADALCFMVNEVMGKSVTTADSKLKNAIAAKLTAEYAKIPANTKQELSRLPANWLKFKENDWFRRGDDFREQMRVHWGQNLEAYIPELQAISKLRRDRLAKLKADPKIGWEKLGSVQRQAALQQSDIDFQNNLRTIASAKTIQLSDRIEAMQVANAIGNSPTRYSLRIKK